ncbi:MAG: tetratricopeptide repeat protein [Candidatus Thorarchaeota archaeon]
MQNIDIDLIRKDYFAGKYDNVIKNEYYINYNEDLLYLIVDSYLELGESEKCLELISNFDRNKTKISFFVWKFYFLSRINYLKGNYTEALDLIDEGLIVNQKESNIFFLTRIMILKSEISWALGKLLEALEYSQMAIGFCTIVGDDFFLASALNSQGMIYRALGELQKSLESHQKALNIRLDYKNPYHITSSLNNIAVIFWTKGNLNQALKYLTDAFSYEDKIINKGIVANWINNIAMIKDTQGYLDEALLMYQQAHDAFKQQKNFSAIATTLCNIAEVCRSQNRLKEAKQNHEKALNIRLTLKNPLHIAESIFYNIVVSKDLDPFFNPQELIDKFPKEPHEHKAIDAIFNMIKAIITQKENNFNESEKYWAKAVKNTNLEFYFRNICIEELVIISFLKWKASPTEYTANELENRLGDWEEMSVNNNLKSSLFKVYYIRAKVSMLELEFDKSIESYKICISIAEEIGLPKHIEFAKRELNKAFTIKNEQISNNNLSLNEYNENIAEDALFSIKNLNKILSEISLP